MFSRIALKLNTFLSKLLKGMFNFILILNSYIVPIRILDRILCRPHLPPSLNIRFLSMINPYSFDLISRKKALFVFRRASKFVPAYKKFLSSREIDSKKVNNIKKFNETVPQTDKENYVKIFPMADRCINGRLPKTGYLDESSGSTGISVDWIRSVEEEKPYMLQIRPIINYLYEIKKKKQYVLMNGFILGVWAGGRRFLNHVGPIGIVKNIGPDAKMIVQSISELGPKYIYIIGGYPTLLREVVESGNAMNGFDWKKHDVHLFTGGEGFSEKWREYVKFHLGEKSKIFSMYGALDLELGMALETPLSLAVRKILNDDIDLRKDVLSDDRYPCYIGQYSPLNCYIRESINKNRKKEIEITLLNISSVSPKIKYNINDEGGVFRFDTLQNILKEKGIDIYDLVKENTNTKVLHMPFLYLFGRSDGSVTIDGALIFPSDVKETISSDEELSSTINSFRLYTEMDDSYKTHLHIYLETKEDVKTTKSLSEKCQDLIFNRMINSNPCFRHSYENDPERAKPVIHVCAFKTGIFEN